MRRLGRYQLVGLIAAGGMAKVYLARVHGEGGFEREMAIKVMHDHLRDDPDFVKMFLDEARLAARLRHPNVVPTLDVQKTPEALFLAMEFIEGLSLSALMMQVSERDHRTADSPGELEWDSDNGVIRQQPTQAFPLPVDVALRIARDLLSGLDAAHELADRDGSPLNIVHRDVSPANVLVGTDGVIRITDFGVARAEERLASTQGSALKGKIPYLAAEQIEEAVLDRRTDVYAAGVVLWEMLAGRRLFAGPNEGAVLKHVLDGANVVPSAINPSVPPMIDNVCMRALSLDRDRRFGTAAAFADALEEAATFAEVRVADQRRIAKYIGEFETNTAKIRVSESMMAGQLEPAVHEVLNGYGAAMSDEGASTPSAGNTKTAAILDQDELAALTGRPSKGRAAAWVMGIAALIGGFAIAFIAFGGAASSGGAATAAGAESLAGATPVDSAMADGGHATHVRHAVTGSTNPAQPPPGGTASVDDGAQGTSAGSRPRRPVRPSKPKPTQTALPSEFLPPEL